MSSKRILGSLKKKRLNNPPVFYQVERILDKRLDPDGEIEYKIRWKGFNSSSDTWESIDNCVRSFASILFLFLGFSIVLI